MAKVYKTATKAASIIAAGDPLMRQTAERVESTAKAEAAKHKDSGDYLRSIQTARGGGQVKDYIVYSDDPLAISKEFGHTTPDGKFVDGVHAFGKALAAGARGV